MGFLYDYFKLLTAEAKKIVPKAISANIQTMQTAYTKYSQESTTKDESEIIEAKNQLFLTYQELEEREL